MTANACPVCGKQLPLEAMNIAEGVALCPSCGRLSRLSDVASRKRPIAEVLQQPPPGCLVSDTGQEIVVYATLRSLGGFFGSLFVTLFWNGIVSLFVLIAFAGLYTNLIGSLPVWFPAPEAEPAMSLGMTLFLCVFLLPFVTIGSIMGGSLLMNAGGRVEVSLGRSDAFVRMGIGFLAWRRRFDPAQVRRVSLGTTSWQMKGQPNDVVVIEADRTIKFGSLLQSDRREWLQTILHELLAEPDSNLAKNALSLARRT